MAGAKDELRGYLSHYYGTTIRRTEDLEYQACCVDDTRSRYADILPLIPDEVKEKNYGCGCSIPPDDLTGLHVLDLGSGAGLDAFIVARIVGEDGFVHGIDMTDEQLDVARSNIGPVMDAFGHTTPNVEFHKGFIETVEAIEDSSIDLVISDCTINLSPAKEEVFASIFRVLKPGGEFYISDIVADRRVPDSLRSDAKLVAECLGGALYEYDLMDIIADAGFVDPRIVSRKLVEEDVDGVPIRFCSATLRGFKISDPPLDRRCEDYGQVAFYRGNCSGSPSRFELDGGHVFEAGRPVLVCRNSARMLTETRLGRYFEVTVERGHLGIFDCAALSSVESLERNRCC